MQHTPLPPPGCRTVIGRLSAPYEVNDVIDVTGPKRPVELATMPQSRFTEAVTQDYRNILWF